MSTKITYLLFVVAILLHLINPSTMLAENKSVALVADTKITIKSSNADKQQCIDLAYDAIKAKIARKEMVEMPFFFPRPTTEAPEPAPAVEEPKAVFAENASVEAPFISGGYIPEGFVLLDEIQAEALISPVPVCSRAAEQGEPLAQMIIGLCFREGIGVTKDIEKAEKQFKTAIERYKYDAEKGNIEAQFQLGEIYADKLIKQDMTEALKWYTKAADSGDGKAQFTLGKIHLWGLGIKRDTIEAEKWFALASDKHFKNGVCSEYLKIAKSYLSGDNGLKQDETAAINWFKKAILIDRDRVGRVLFDIGKKLLANNKDTEAKKWLDWSVTQGASQLILNQALHYQNIKNYADAAKLHHILAEHGDSYSQSKLGLWYQEGGKVKQDFIEAEKWLRMAANQGDYIAQNVLGDLYYEGQGVNKNFGAAVDWYKKAADQDSEDAQYSLGFMYRNGEGVPKNYSEALKLFQKASDLGNSSAQKALGLAYYYGEGVSADKIQALAWATLAATKNSDAAKVRDSIEKDLQPNDVVKAQQVAAKLQIDIDKNYQRKYYSYLDKERTSILPRRTVFPSITPTSNSTPAFTSNDIAVIIGIEKYRSVPPTEYAAADAGLVRDYLKALGIPERNIEFLADDRATLSDIRKVIETKLPNMVKASSRVIVYYAGHGAPGATKGESYLVPYDGDPSFLADTAYPLSRLYDRISRLKAKEVLVILDSCFSGAGGRSVLAKNTRPLVMVKDTPPPASKKMIVLTSSRGSQITTSLSEVGHGAFTYFFLRALQEGNRDIGEVYAYLNPRVTEEAKRQNVDQTPTISPAPDKLKGRFLFAR